MTSSKRFAGRASAANEVPLTDGNNCSRSASFCASAMQIAVNRSSGPATTLPRGVANAFTMNLPGVAMLGGIIAPGTSFRSAASTCRRAPAPGTMTSVLVKSSTPL